MSDPATNVNLPVKSGDDFVGELETMDLSALKGEQFMVSVSAGDRSGPKFLCTAQRGPFTFEEMCESVGTMWKEEQHHAKVIVCNKDFKAPLKFLDENTVDYIEAHFQDIIVESMLNGVFDENKDYTCRAGVLETLEDNPLADVNKTKPEEPDEDDDQL